MSRCKKKVFKQQNVSFNYIPRNFFPFRFVFFRESFLIHSGSKLLERPITSCNFIFLRFGDYSFTKKRGNVIHFRNKSTATFSKQKKNMQQQFRKKRKLDQQIKKQKLKIFKSKATTKSKNLSKKK